RGLTVVAIIFWVAAGLLLFTHFGYPVALWVLQFLGLGNRAGEVRGRRIGSIPSPLEEQGRDDPDGPLPPAVSLIIAAYNEEVVIEGKVRDALALEYPRDRLQVIVASDGSTDRTVQIARDAGADLVLDLPRGGKVKAQNAAAAAATGTILAFSDANSTWESGALLELVEPFRDPRVGYVCGQVSFTGPGGGN